MGFRTLTITLSDPDAGIGDITYELHERREGFWLGAISGSGNLMADPLGGARIAEVVAGIVDEEAQLHRAADMFFSAKKRVDSLAADLACPRCGEGIGVAGRVALAEAADDSAINCPSCGNNVWLALSPSS